MANPLRWATFEKTFFEVGMVRPFLCIRYSFKIGAHAPRQRNSEIDRVPNWWRNIKFKALDYNLLLWLVLWDESSLRKLVSKWAWFGRFYTFVHHFKFGHTRLVRELVEIDRVLDWWQNLKCEALDYKLLLWKIIKFSRKLVSKSA